MKRTFFLLAFAATFFCACNEKNTPTDSKTSSGTGMLPGEFSVSDTTKVHFSQGNLQYVGMWLFATNQWDYFGNSQSDNHRDLFGWGTGDAPNKVSIDDNDYATFSDWGINAIINGGNETNLWRTLTRDEWAYLFNTRTNAATLFGLGSVNGVNGTILLPDGWTTPKGATFNASTTQGVLIASGGYYFTNDFRSNCFSHNAYTVDQWSVMESAGAVFLPAAGLRGNTVMCVGSEGYYWPATPEHPRLAYYLHFDSVSLDPGQYMPSVRSNGLSVRLVQDIE